MQTVSIVVPVMDEQETVQTLAERITCVFTEKLTDTATLNEIIFVDDGSQDETWLRIQAISNDTVQGLRLRRNFGKAAALQAGVSRATGDIVITMDGDLQDDPDEIPKLLELIRSGFDVVSGWKRVRHDPMGKTLPSRLFNYVTARISGVRIHDFNCGFKAYRREVFESVDLYGELHRFIPALAASMGYTVTEMEVLHHPRRFGRSKYGVGRLIKGFLDLLTVVTITKYNSRPGHLFGTAGLTLASVGAIVNLYLLAIWLAGEAIGHRPLLLLGVLLVIVGVQFILFGMMAELIVSKQPHARSRNIVAERTGRTTAQSVRTIPA
ncbi:glycosyltransferase family 2 protein [Coralloluteibacterium thermophilus]|uniref:Glycosyltransferase family 2 protein n=1 Tax=Coralloluteibacterium thermophilum TaxID=2707049 RepID=A0ABV9NIS2_9GAMM